MGAPTSLWANTASWNSHTSRTAGGGIRYGIFIHLQAHDFLSGTPLCLTHVCFVLIDCMYMSIILKTECMYYYVCIHQCTWPRAWTLQVVSPWCKIATFRYLHKYGTFRYLHRQAYTCGKEYICEGNMNELKALDINMTIELPFISAKGMGK